MAARDTIAAIASAAGSGARAVIRVSGGEAAGLVERTCRGGAGPLPPAERGLVECIFHDGAGEQPALLLWMPGPASYTAEDVAEFHLPGNPHLARVALERLLELGARQAARGEFTRRAFEHGRMDLTRAEGVLALVHASSQAERRAATALLVGGLEERLAALREGVDGLRALAEASLDFDEADTGHVPVEALLERAAQLEAGLEEALGWEEARAPATSLPRVVLAGPPNAGKSSLFNALTSGSQRAIVDPGAGSTRDVLGGLWNLGRAQVRLEDSAGREVAEGELGEGSQALARRAAEGADLVLWVEDASLAGRSAGHQQSGPEVGQGVPLLRVWNQIDRAPDAGDSAGGALLTSAATGAGLPALAEAVLERLGLAREGPSTAELSARHRSSLREAREALESGAEGLRAGAPLDLVAEALREATEALDSIHGSTTPEDLLDRIFASFCIGK